MSNKKYTVCLDFFDFESDWEYFLPDIFNQLPETREYKKEELIEIWETIASNNEIDNYYEVQDKYFDFVVGNYALDHDGLIVMKKLIDAFGRLSTAPSYEYFVSFLEDYGYHIDDKEEWDCFCDIVKEEDGKYLIFIKELV